MSAFAADELDHLPPDRARRVRRLFNLTPPLEPLDVDEWPYPHVPGEAEPIDGPLPIALEDLDELEGGSA